ncbi:MAG: class I SAM-dependent methyltransferase [Armatimonadota bacterium]
MSFSFWDWYAALGYDALNVVLPYQALQEQVYAAAAPTAGERLFIAGCGTGNLEALTVQRIPDMQIDAVDYSARMLARARAKCAGYPTVRHRQGNLCEPLPYDTGTFDVVVMCNVLYALPARETALREISRIVRPGGRFILCDRPPGSEPRFVTQAHIAALRALPAGAQVTGWLRTLSALPALLAVMAINKKIQRCVGSGEYYFYPVTEITDLLTSLGFAVQQVESAYAEQCWLLHAIRSHTGGGC